MEAMWKTNEWIIDLLSCRGMEEALGTPRFRRLVSFDLNVSVPVVKYVFNLLVLNALGQMIVKADTDLCIIRGLCRSETARNYSNCRPFLAFQTSD
jgi:hypothetical protein